MTVPGVGAVKVVIEAASRAISGSKPESADPQDSFANNWAGLGSFAEPLLCRLEPKLYGPVIPPLQAPPTLPRPVLFLHGLTGSPAQFQGMMDWLERDGANKDGGYLKADHLEDLDPQANMFALRFSKPWNTIETNVAEIKATVEAICQATGAESVDLVCHSKGGLDARAYLMDPEEKVERVVTVSTPHHGSYPADLTCSLLQSPKASAVSTLCDPDLAQTMRELSADTVSKKGEVNNPTLHQLNEEWETQQERAEFLLITGNGIPTVTGLPGVTLKGDGVVSRESATMPEAQTRNFWGSDHIGVLRDPRIMTAAAEFLISEPLAR